jgi:hypothetical protein
MRFPKKEYRVQYSVLLKSPRREDRRQSWRLPSTPLEDGGLHPWPTHFSTEFPYVDYVEMILIQ